MPALCRFSFLWARLLPDRQHLFEETEMNFPIYTYSCSVLLGGFGRSASWMRS